ncbi:MAG: hypothetical protein HOB45_08065, partial [Planctomycetaceae bacterium]|nr:hypothetical protein [Planctomycetaceae bacterium]
MARSSKTRTSIRDAVRRHPNKGSGRKWLQRIIAVSTCLLLLIFFASWWAGAFTEPEVVAEIHTMVDEEVAYLAKVARNEIPYGSSDRDMGEWFQKFRDVPEQYRGQIRQDMGRLFAARERAATQSYFALPQNKRQAEMDRRIQAEEARSKERRERWAAERAAREKADTNRQPSSQNEQTAGGQESRRDGQDGNREAGQGRRGPPRTEDTRNDWMKRRLDNSSPDERARRTEYRRAMTERREQLGIEPGRGGGPPGRRGPPG